MATATVKSRSEHARTDGKLSMTGRPSRSHPASAKAVAKIGGASGQEVVIERQSFTLNQHI